MTVKSGIYCIVHKVSGKRYVGSAKDILERCRTHRHHLNRRKHHASKLQRAWDKHGPDAFLFKVLERVPRLDDLLVREQFWIDAYRSASEAGYNSLAIAGSPRGFVMSEDQKAKLRKANLGKKRAEHQIRRGYTYSDASKAKMAAKKLGVPRKPFTLETKQRMAEASRKKQVKWTESGDFGL